MDRQALVREHKLRELIAELDQAADRLIRCAGTLEPAKVLPDELGRVSVAIEPAHDIHALDRSACDLDELLGVEGL